MSSTVMIDGHLVPPERAQVSVFDRGFLYGDSVFESLRSYRGKPFALDEHLVRLSRSAARVAIRLPVSLDTLRAEIRYALQVQRTPESYLRLTLTRGIGRSLGLDPELADEPLRVLLVTAFTPPPAEIYEQGIAAITYRGERASDAAGVTDAKVGNYLLAVLAMGAARAIGAREALIEDGRGQILEGAASNVFALIAGKLVTPPESSAILAGITRGHVLELARNAGLEVDLRPIAKSELGAAEEIFVTSSLRELVPVVSIDGKAVGSGNPGPTTRDLLRSYRALAER